MDLGSSGSLRLGVSTPSGPRGEGRTEESGWTWDSKEVFVVTRLWYSKDKSEKTSSNHRRVVPEVPEPTTCNQG